MKKYTLIFFAMGIIVSGLLINNLSTSVSANSKSATKSYQKKIDKLNLTDKSVSTAKKSIKKTWKLRKAQISVVDNSDKEISNNTDLNNKQVISSTFTLNKKNKITTIILKTNNEVYKSLNDRREQELRSLNNWYKNSYTEEQAKLYSEEGKDYYSTNYVVKETVVHGFTVDDGNIVVQISNNQLSAEKVKQKDIANFGMNVVLPDYKGNLNIFKNVNKDGSLKDDVLLNPMNYSTLVN
ncbi:hypothetical protein ESZ50_07870 [Weissella muntiaci]|uniref:Uncharacterized protein n=1 Tax=Weissella muntiaci TaxID=2508881 RepID=A0A6C2C699_9LACO|nr:hypothetical protein [Weissella muntiaci]TYC48785.1 hypothetical protein ESZ50_07870 [Weissella muntiaci]